MKLKIINTTGTNSTITVSDELFAKKVNQVLLAQAVRVYMSNLRQSTSKTKARGDVKRTSKKWYKQKGTGNARHGDKTATLFVGGAVAHGPRGVENWKRTLTKILKKTALKSALKAQEENIIVNDEILNSNGKTKKAVAVVSKLVDKKDKVLVVLAEAKPEVVRALRNIEKVLITKVSRLNALEVARADKIVFTKEALKALATRLLKVKKESQKLSKSEKKSKESEKVSKLEKPAAKKPAAKKVAKKTEPKKAVSKPAKKAAKPAAKKITKPSAKKVSAKKAADTKNKKK